MFDLTNKDIWVWLAVLLTVLTVATVIYFFILAKTSKGRLRYEQIVKAAEAGVAKADGMTDASNTEKKKTALDFVINYLTKTLGIKSKNVDTDFISNLIEKVYKTEFKFAQVAYNVGLSTNNDDSEKQAFEDKDKNGTPDIFDEPSKLDLKSGTVTQKQVAKDGTVKAKVVDITTTTTTVKPVDYANNKATIPAKPLEQPATTVKPQAASTTVKPVQTTTVKPKTAQDAPITQAEAQLFNTGVNTAK